MAIPSLSGSSISSTYNRLVQTDGTIFADGTGSVITALNITSSAAVSASYALTASYAVSASYEIIKEESSSFADTASYVNPLVQDVEATGSLNFALSGLSGTSTNPLKLLGGGGVVRFDTTNTEYRAYSFNLKINSSYGGTGESALFSSFTYGGASPRIGIGTTTPSSKLHIKGSGTTSATTALRVENANASASLLVRDDGNVGIGTTTPIGKLHVSGSTSIIDNELQLGNRTGKSGVLLLKGQGGPTYSITGSDNTLSFNLTTGASKGFISFNNPIKEVFFPRNTGGTFKILSAASASMDNNEGGLLIEDQTIILSNGKAIYISSDSTGGIIRTTSYGSTGTAGKLQFQVGGNTLNPLNPLPDTKMVLDTDGNVGIGTTTPLHNLHISGSILIGNYGSSTSLLRFANISNDGNSAYIGRTVAAQFEINGGSVNSFRIQIPTGTDTFPLTLYGNGANTAQFYRNQRTRFGGSLSTNPSSIVEIIGSGTTSSTTAFRVENANASASMVVLDNGNVNISGDIILGNAKGIYFDNGIGPKIVESSNGIQMWANGAGSDKFLEANGHAQLTLYTNEVPGVDDALKINKGGTSTTLMYISGSGNVGIGTSTPSYKLDVSGSGRFTDGLTITGSTNIYKSGSTVLNIEGSTGQLFSVTDSLTGSLFSVNTVAGLPVIEAFSDNSVNIGKFGQYAIKVTGSNVTLANILTITPQDPLPTSGVPTGSFAVSSSAPPKPYFWDGTSWNALY